MQADSVFLRSGDFCTSTPWILLKKQFCLSYFVELGVQPKIHLPNCNVFGAHGNVGFPKLPILLGLFHILCSNKLGFATNGCTQSRSTDITDHEQLMSINFNVSAMSKLQLNTTPSVHSTGNCSLFHFPDQWVCMTQPFSIICHIDKSHFQVHNQMYT